MEPSLGQIFLWSLAGSVLLTALLSIIGYLKHTIGTIKTLREWGYPNITPSFAKAYKIPWLMAIINNILVNKTQMGKIKFFTLVAFILFALSKIA